MNPNNQHPKNHCCGKKMALSPLIEDVHPRLDHSRYPLDLWVGKNIELIPARR